MSLPLIAAFEYYNNSLGISLEMAKRTSGKYVFHR
jgi:hypothetical protein